ncbi:MAG: hypothetical protein AAB706_00530 [Patescibacteria group bacterium]
MASSVSIIPNPINNISQRVGEVKTYSMTINNSGDFDVSDFTFGNLTSLGFVFQNATTFKNSTKTINFTVNPTTSFSGTRIEKIEFKFLADIPIVVTTYPINISPGQNGGFSPNYITVRAGDTVTWTNKDTVFHNVFSSQFNQNINPNETFSYTFGSTGIFSYVDQGYNQFNAYHGTVEVISRTSQEKVHNPNYDFNWNLDLNFFLNPTNITFEVLDTSFDVFATGSSDGLIRIKNVGSNRAERINLTANSNWISFEENNFNLEPNEQNIITYTVSPLIFSTNETNKTYTINISIIGSNIQSDSKQILVFVPFTEIFQDTQSAEFVFSLLDKFCKANPNNLFCNPNRNITTSGNTTEGNFTLNMTSGDLFEFLRRFSNIETTSIRQENKLSSLTDNYNTKLLNIENNATASYNKQFENESLARRNSNLRWISGVVFVICGCIIFGFWKYRRVKRKIGFKEGAYEYRTN